ncbi:MAG: replicative DNA helicase [Streptococcaceae bacterium]|jgi:replicative DNA helicase|nr:replicative DNA helicase [Streptococcaceae bacterium]
MSEIINRIPPNDTNAEKAVLGSVFLESDRLIEAMEFLTSEDFYSYQHQVIFQAMEKLNGKNQPIDALTMTEELERANKLEEAGGFIYLSELTEIVPTAANITYYAQIVYEKSLKRKLISATSDAARLAFDENDETDNIIAQAEDLILKVTEKTNKAGFKKISDVVTDSLQIIEKNYGSSDVVTGLATGYIDFDRVTTGLHPGQLMVLAARPAMGKTALALNFAQNVGTKSSETVALFSLEMTATDLVNRMLCAEGLIDSQHLRTGKLNEEEWEKLIFASGSLSLANIHIDDTPGIKVNEIRAKCRKLWQENNGLGLIVIDYLQLIESGNNENRQQQISEISRQLKKLAMELSCPVVALSQLSRSVESRDDKRPMLSDLRESGAIEQDADIVAFLYRDDYYKRNSDEDEGVQEDKTDVIAELILAKNRAGQTKTLELMFKMNYNKFANYTSQISEMQYG